MKITTKLTHTEIHLNPEEFYIVKAAISLLYDQHDVRYSEDDLFNHHVEAIEAMARKVNKRNTDTPLARLGRCRATYYNKDGQSVSKPYLRGILVWLFQRVLISRDPHCRDTP